MVLKALHDFLVGVEVGGAVLHLAVIQGSRSFLSCGFILLKGVISICIQL